MAAAIRAGRQTGGTGAADGRAPGIGATVMGALALALVWSVMPETWLGAAGGAGVAAAAATAIARLSRRGGWSIRHGAAVGLGFLVGRGLLAFTYFPLIGDVSPAGKYSHNVGMLALVCLAGWLALRPPPQEARSIGRVSGA